MMRVQNKHKYVGGLLMLCVGACVCLFLISPVGERWWSGEGVAVAVAVAKRSLPATTVVTVDDFVKHTVSRAELSKRQVSNPGRVVGRVLAVPVVEGQILNESHFLPDRTGVQLAAALPDGMRAFTISLSGSTIPDRFLLYPGCVVDVLSSSKLEIPDAREESVCTTILQGIQVLAVHSRSLVLNPQAEEDDEATPTYVTDALKVTLLVDRRQAEILQSAIDNGNISLAIRNPLDKSLRWPRWSDPNKERLVPDLPTSFDFKLRDHFQKYVTTEFDM